MKIKSIEVFAVGMALGATLLLAIRRRRKNADSRQQVEYEQAVRDFEGEGNIPSGTH
jgi:hypothetical protein